MGTKYIGSQSSLLPWGSLSSLSLSLLMSCCLSNIYNPPNGWVQSCHLWLPTTYSLANWPLFWHWPGSSSIGLHLSLPPGWVGVFLPSFLRFLSFLLIARPPPFFLLRLAIWASVDASFSIKVLLLSTVCLSLFTLPLFFLWACCQCCSFVCHPPIYRLGTSHAQKN